MKSNLKKQLLVAALLVGQFIFAQTKSVSGTVSDTGGIPLAGVSILESGTTNGTQTDFDGNYSLTTKAGAKLVFSYVSMKTQTVTVTGSTLDVVMQDDVQELEGVVVTALGIKREKKALGYATQEVSGDDISDTPVTNFADALSGEVAGLDIQSSGTMGGSSNIIVRGYNSIAGNNQALIIIDGTPILNDNTNSGDQTTGRGGYDYGNAAMDINPDDIASLNVLKGAAATALYGSRASNGAIIITTKKGRKGDNIGVTFTSSITAGQVDKSTLPRYQDKYGAGYGQYYDDPSGYFLYEDFSGNGTNDLLTPFTEDASYGAAFDPTLNVFQWNSIYPQLDGYKVATPWVAGANNPNSIFETALTATNSISFGKSTTENSFRLGFTNKTQEGVMPNSSLKRNTLTFSGSQKLSEKLNVSVDGSYTNTGGKGRNGTGYDSRNPMQAFRQWWQTNVDLGQQKDAFFSTGENITWNANSTSNLTPAYTDNVYWTLYKNYQTDNRERVFGNAALTYEVNDWLNVLGRITYDGYSEIREERTEVGSNDVSKYENTKRKSSEVNYDLMATASKRFNEITLDGIIGTNIRVNNYNMLNVSTNGGLIFPGVFTLDNTKNPITQDQINKIDYTKKVDGIFAKAGIGYKGTYYLDLTARRDRSSALPKANNTYFYSSVAGSLIFSNLIKKDWLNFGKLRANYAEVGNDTDPYHVFKTYDIGTSFGNASTASNASLFNNEDLKSEKTKDLEFGLEVQLFNNRLGFDFSYYNRVTEDLITPVDVSTATGASKLYLNGADMENKGIEFMVNATPIKINKFTWDVKLNYAQNRSEVIRVADGIEFIQLASVQGGVTLGAKLGEPFGVIRGRDYVYHENGQPIIGSNGYYQRTSSSAEVIGNINPDWTGGVKNNFKYGNFSMSFLIDIQKGGDVFSLDTWYGYATGLYDFTAGTNDLGNPVRNSIADGGGVILDGVKEDGTPNDVRASATSYANPWGYVRTPNAAHVYDASFVKLRELTVGFDFPKSITEKLSISRLTFNVIGRNLWIIHKNTPFSDPEAGLSSGNIQGNQSGVYPAVKEFGASLKVEF